MDEMLPKNLRKKPKSSKATKNSISNHESRADASLKHAHGQSSSVKLNTFEEEYFATAYEKEENEVRPESRVQKSIPSNTFEEQYFHSAYELDSAPYMNENYRPSQTEEGLEQEYSPLIETERAKHGARKQTRKSKPVNEFEEQYFDSVHERTGAHNAEDVPENAETNAFEDSRSHFNHTNVRPSRKSKMLSNRSGQNVFESEHGDDVVHLFDQQYFTGSHSPHSEGSSQQDQTEQIAKSEKPKKRREKREKVAVRPEDVSIDKDIELPWETNARSSHRSENVSERRASKPVDVANRNEQVLASGLRLHGDKAGLYEETSQAKFEFESGLKRSGSRTGFGQHPAAARHAPAPQQVHVEDGDSVHDFRSKLRKEQVRPTPNEEEQSLKQKLGRESGKQDWMKGESLTQMVIFGNHSTATCFVCFSFRQNVDGQTRLERLPRLVGPGSQLEPSRRQRRRRHPLLAHSVRGRYVGLHHGALRTRAEFGLYLQTTSS